MRLSTVGGLISLGGFAIALPTQAEFDSPLHSPLRTLSSPHSDSSESTAHDGLFQAVSVQKRGFFSDLCKKALNQEPLSARGRYIIGYRTVGREEGQSLLQPGRLSGSAPPDDELGPGKYASPRPGEYVMTGADWFCVITALKSAWTNLLKVYIPESTLKAGFQSKRGVTFDAFARTLQVPGQPGLRIDPDNAVFISEFSTHHYLPEYTGGRPGMLDTFQFLFRDAVVDNERLGIEAKCFPQRVPEVQRDSTYDMAMWLKEQFGEDCIPPVDWKNWNNLVSAIDEGCAEF